MNLILAEYTYQTATDTFDCEASQLFWSMARPIDYKGIEFSDVLLFYKAKSGKVKQGERYLQLLFVDSEGEQMEFNAIPAMHKFLFRMGFYPDFMQSAIVAFRTAKRQALTT